MRNRLIQEYRKEFGCKSTGICWCKVCVRIDQLIQKVIDEVKNQIKL